MAKAGFPAPNPKDTTATDCAEIYAKPLGLNQVESIVVSFAPNATDSEQSRYWAEVLKLLD